MIQATNNNFISEKKLQILNFYSVNCPPCHAFMPNFIEAEKTFWKYFDFVAINSSNNIGLFQKFKVMWTPTIIILKNNEIIYNKSWVPNWGELKNFMMNVAEINENDIKSEHKEKKKRFFGLFS